MSTAPINHQTGYKNSASCCAYLDSMLVGHHVGIGDDESVLRHDKARTTGDSQLAL